MNKINYAWMYLFLVTLAGCSMFATPDLDTPNKRFIAFEESYGVVLDKLNEYKAQGLFKDGGAFASSREDIKQLVINVNSARDAMYLAKGMGDISSAETQLTIALTALATIRSRINLKE